MTSICKCDHPCTVYVMVRLVSYTSLDAGPRTKGKPRETAPKITSLVTKSSQPGKRDRKKRKSSEKRALEVIDLTIDKEETQRTVNKRVTDLEDCISRLSNADKLAKSEAGPSRQRSPTYIPTSFTSIPRSILACISDRLSFDLSSRDVSPRKGLNQNGDINVLERLRPFSPAPSTRPDPALPPDGVSEHFEPPGLSSTSMMPNIDPSSGQVELKKPDGLGEDQGRAEEEMKLLLPSHVLLDTKSPARTLQAQGQGERVDDRRGRESSMEGLHFLDDDVTKVCLGAVQQILPNSHPICRAYPVILTPHPCLKQRKRLSLPLQTKARSVRIASDPVIG